MGRSFLKHFLVSIVCLLLAAELRADAFSYIYIQGDKQTPFYIKFEGEMLPRFGKNYYIISELAPGPITIQVLFQQNAFPPQTFVLQVPENGFRGFLLTRKTENFSLYDIHRQFSIPAFNKIEDDKYFLEAKAGAAALQPEPAIVYEKPTPAAAITKAPKPAVSKATTNAKTLPKPATNTAKTSTSTGPKFISNVELKNKRADEENMLPAGKIVKSELAIINSDCPTAMDNDAFEKLLKRAGEKPSDDRLKYIFERMNDCYTSNQVRQLASILNSDAERLTLLKKAYPKVTDQSAFARLENLMSTPEWKGYFRDLIKK
jgi:hypothetical protein